jgi:hypothetical protein
VSKVRVRDGSVWGWNFIWRKRLFEWEESLKELQRLLSTGVWSAEVDAWSWRLDEKGSFSVKSAYVSLAPDFSNEIVLHGLNAFVFPKIL